MKTVIPNPKKILYADKTVKAELKITTAVSEWEDLADSFAKAFSKIYNVEVEKGNGGVTLVCDRSLKANSYVCDFKDSLILKASDREGAGYALATALQVLDVKDGCFETDCAYVEDCPDKDYRALMVDLARCWHPVRTVLRYIDICFLMKIKYLHLHFIDDQAYTLPSKAFPKINNGCRSYTYEDIKNFTSYAKAHGIVIIPEFEAPGHAGFLVKNYPDVFANGIGNSSDATLVTENGDVVTAKNIVCAGKTGSMEGIKTLLSEVCEMFPDSPYIHIGGDEANIKAWNYCSHCKEYMAKNNISDEYELYSDFVARVANLVIGMGKTPIVWEGFPKKGNEKIPRETIVIAWESHYHMAYDLVEEGFKIINASWQPLYIVPSVKHRWGIKEIMGWNVYNWQHWWDKSEAKLNPVNLQPTENVLGAQLCAWEMTYEEEINLVMENLPALSERTWNTVRIDDDAAIISKTRTFKKLSSRLIQEI